MFSTSKTFFRNPTGGGPGPTDPSFAYVPLLLNTTSTNGQQNNTFLDSGTANGGVGFTITRNGTPTQGSITPYWPNGQWSNYFNGSSNLSIASNAALAMGAGNFTIEFWVYLNSATNNRTLAWPVAGNMLIYCDNSGFFAYAAYGVGNVLASSIVTPLNTWTHVAISRSGTNSKIFINGVQGASTTSDSNNWGQSVLNIGSDIAANFLNGYLSNLRIVKGTALYTVPFTPSTTPLTAVTNTVLLTCQSNRFVDNSATPLAITVANGTPRVQAFQPFSPTASYTTALYGGSGYFNGTGSDYLTYTGTALGSGNFTIEFWAYPIETRANAAIYDANNGLMIRQNSANLLIYDRTTTTNFSTTGNLCVPNVWAHIAIVRNSGTITAYINGVSAGSMSDTSNFTGTGYFVSAFYDSRTSTNTFYGYLSNFRAVVGTAVYTANFTPPTAPVTAIANTSLLLNMTNAGIYDAAVQNNAITVGNAQVSTAQSKWSPTSMKFDGSGDALNIVSNPALNFGSGSFTLEAWVYLITMSGDYFTIGSSGAGGAFFGFRTADIGYGRPNVGWDYQAASGMVINNWYHIAYSRSGTSMRMFVNGTQVGATQTTSQAYDLSLTSTTVGALHNANFLNGYIQDLRITRGIGRYTANFSVPTAAFPTR
jgi:hypothetical protein